MYEFTSAEMFTPNSVPVFCVKNPVECNDFSHLIGKDVKILDKVWNVVAVERFAHCAPWREGELIALRVRHPAQCSIDTPAPETIQRLAELHYYQPDAATMDIRLHRFAVAVCAHIAQRAPVDSVALNLDAQLRAAVKERNELREKLAQRAASGDAEPVYQIASDSGPSSWSDVTKEEFDLHTVTTWRKKRILFSK